MGGSYQGNSGALEFRYQCCLEGSERCQILSTEGCRSFRGYLRYSSRMPKRNWELYEKRQPMTSLVERKEQPVTSLEMIFCLSLFLPHDGDIISRRKKFPAGEKILLRPSLFSLDSEMLSMPSVRFDGASLFPASVSLQSSN